ncbi:mannosyltransferase putative-domain-containing protein [Delphinella strobiligena]|nr:mannosyltransferase putative-domain-containing protein [Delphinella strobiligena]
MLFSWTTPYFASHMNLHASLYKAGRGIVLSAGEDQVPYLLATIPAMRQVGCDLPIEIMYLGDEDISEEYRDELEKISGVVTRDMKQMVRDSGWELKGWAAKPFAMLLSSFQEVMFIDADAVFFRNPESLFEDPQYQKTGALFFKDRSLFPESKRRWLRSILPKPISKSVQRSRLWTGESGHQQESGVILVDKWRHFVEMLLVTRMNGPDRDGNKAEGIEGIYDMVYGDKETFWLAWELLSNRDYAFHEGYRGTMGQLHHGPVSPEVSILPAEIRPAVIKSDITENDPVLEGSDPTEIQDSNESRKKAKAAAVNGQKTHGQETLRPDTLDIAAEVDSSLLPVQETTHQISQHSIPEDLELDTARESYTICAPQLLHLDAEGRPLWLNGWIARNKYKDPSQSIPGIFEVYIMEPPMASKTDAWRLRDNNVACLTADVVTQFTEQERDVLDMVMGFAKEVGDLGDRKKDGKVHVYL